MNLTKNGVTIEVADAMVVEMVLQRLSGSASPANLRLSAAPRIGEIWHGQGGIYTGVARGRDGAADYHLITALSESDALSYDKALAFAAAFTAGGFNDFSAPWRAEQALQFANVPELFKKEWYWSCERANSDSAWVQYFGYGNQTFYRKDDEFPVRAVRRVAIQ
jgi:hypothetical protein